MQKNNSAITGYLLQTNLHVYAKNACGCNDSRY